MIDKDFFLSYLNSLYPHTECFLNHQNDYQLLFAVILSAQTTDKKVNSVTSSLFKKYDSLKKIEEADISDLEEILKPLGLYKNKAQYLKDAASVLIERFDGKVPCNREDLLTIPGVGNKTACVILGELFSFPVIPVDTHIKRISKRLGLSKREDPSLIQKDLEKRFKGCGIDFHRQLILFGRNICKAVSPKCNECSLKDSCPFYSSLKSK